MKSWLFNRYVWNHFEFNNLCLHIDYCHVNPWVDAPRSIKKLANFWGAIIIMPGYLLSTPFLLLFCENPYSLWVFIFTDLRNFPAHPNFPVLFPNPTIGRYLCLPQNWLGLITFFGWLLCSVFKNSRSTLTRWKFLILSWLMVNWLAWCLRCEQKIADSSHTIGSYHDATETLLWQLSASVLNSHALKSLLCTFYMTVSNAQWYQSMVFLIQLQRIGSIPEWKTVRQTMKKI